jgi:predicted nucleotide-binding protein
MPLSVGHQYKKLYARLLKTDIERYLITSRCENILIEHGADELFEACVRHVRQQSRVAVLAAAYTGDHREALGLFIDQGIPQEPWLPAFVALLLDFAAWKQETGGGRPDFTPVVEALLELGVPPENIEPLAKMIGQSPKVSPTAAAAMSEPAGRAQAAAGELRARLFIGSSREGIPIAEALQAGLDHELECTIWNQGVFGLSSAAIEALEKQLTRSDFAVLVVSPDDMTESRGATTASPRDNVLFELGLFMGALGRSRTFVVRPRKAELKMPSDLNGITVARYDDTRSDGNLLAAVGTACSEIKRAVKESHPRGRVAG